MKSFNFSEDMSKMHLGPIGHEIMHLCGVGVTKIAIIS